MFIDESKIETRAFINGEYVDSLSKGRLKKNSSLTGKRLVEIVSCNEEDVNIAVNNAKTAFESGVWSDMTPEERKNVILRFADLLEEHIDELARLDTYETCRAYNNYLYDSLPKAIEAIRYFAEAVDKVYDIAIPPKKDSFGVIYRKPLGVVAVITPWNDPMVVTSWKSIPALLMGNSIIIKPAEQSSLSAIRTAEFAKMAGIPDGVYNVLPGKGEVVGKALAEHKDIRGVFFTGSSEVGKNIIRYSSDNMKKVGLECGGKSPYIVTKNCKNLKKSAETLASNVFYNQGQICSAPSRLIIDSSIKEEFLRYLFDAANEYIPGDSYNIGNKVGCVVSIEQYDRVMKYIEIGKNESGSYYEAKGCSDLPEGALGIYPIIFYDVKENAVIAREEIFGPVITVLEYSDIDEAIKIANDSRYGLAGAVWTDDLNEAYYVSKKIESGLVHINSYGEDDNMSPFGGLKESGLGKDKSVYAFDEYSELKSVWIKTV
ncbi:MAG: aldehyde dehydrogenase family protein [Eubacterium sp.]|nr:aldehyde dehydrogenase family protein [Eubacterium sp.]